MAKRTVGTPREKRALENKPPGVVASSEVKKPGSVVESSRARAPALPWDAESTGSNTDEGQCEHCEQLKRAMPPSHTKRATLTTVNKRIKTHKFTPKNNRKVLQVRHERHSQSSEQQWEAESFESDSKPSVHFKPKLNLMSTQQIVKQFVSSSVLLSTPPRRLIRRRRDTDTKLQDERTRRKNPGPLYSFAFSGTKSKAG